MKLALALCAIDPVGEALIVVVEAVKPTPPQVRPDWLYHSTETAGRVVAGGGGPSGNACASQHTVLAEGGAGAAAIWGATLAGHGNVSGNDIVKYATGGGDGAWIFGIFAGFCLYNL